MRKPRTWRRNRRKGGDGGAGAPSSPLSGAGTFLRLMPPLLLLTLGGATAAALFSRSRSFSGGGPRHFPPTANFVVDRTQVAVASPISSIASLSASPKLAVHSNNTTMLCDCKGGHADEKRRRRQKRMNIWRAEGDDGGGPYHDWELLRADMEEMMGTLRIYVYPDARQASSAFSGVFLPHADPSNPRLGNYHSEHMFKHALLRSPLLSPQPRQAHLFFLPISINALRNHPRVRSEAAISDFVARYVDRLRRELPFWNASGGADHFFVSCHSIGRDAAARHRQLRDNALHVSCSSSYFQRNYVAHKDVALPQVWPRPPERSLNPPGAR
ncbi:hypothetical protein Taro_031498 [Colocasia esculenta]|uniref:Exostosin GT47 domain-containing protein n=1 Tax=Colocasia esculenta TaxID=4460 RepID=A0A843W3A9_COLES|nr:hypothetical protein [Colocasia esculenta]